MSTPTQAPHTTTGDSERKELTTLQWIAIALGVCALAILCIAAGRWQWHRHIDRDAFIASVNENYNSTPVELSQVLPRTDSHLDDSLVWIQATVTGHYLTDQTALLRNRPVNQTPSVHVLVPFESDDGTILVVNRGWLPYDNNAERPHVIPDPPAGEVTITVHLRQNESPTHKTTPKGQVRSINVSDVLAQGASYAGVPAPTPGSYFANAYGSLENENPAPITSVRALPKPDLDPKNHLSYAFQWWVFAIGGACAFVVLFIRERKVVRYGREGKPANPFIELDRSLEQGAARGESGNEELRRQVRPSKQERARRSRMEEDYEDSLFE